MKRIKKLFTLIELIVVIVVLGILAAIVIPNISSFKEEAKETALLADTRNIQTATDIFALKNNGMLPTKDIPTWGNPQIVELYALQPNYLRDLPKDKTAKFWLDGSQTVWGSTADAPMDVNYDEETGILSWKHMDQAYTYNIYKGNVKKIAASAKSPSFERIESGILPTGSTGTIQQKEVSPSSENLYLITAVDKYGFESVPVKAGTTYRGYGDGPDKNHEVISEESNVPEVPVKPGVFVQYGTFNGHPLVWNVVDKKQGNMTLFLSEPLKTATGSTLTKRFNATNVNKWETSEMRGWLNTTFYSEAFGFNSPLVEVSSEHIVSKSHASEATIGTEEHVYKEPFAEALQNYASTYKRTSLNKVYLPTLNEMVNRIYPALGESTYNQKNWIWLMDARGGNINDVRAFNTTGNFGHSNASFAGGGIRPMITVQFEDFKAGDGTSLNPYTIQ